MCLLRKEHTTEGQDKNKTKPVFLCSFNQINWNIATFHFDVKVGNSMQHLESFSSNRI